jgi:hypothetical protein
MSLGDSLQPQDGRFSEAQQRAQCALDVLSKLNENGQLTADAIALMEVAARMVHSQPPVTLSSEGIESRSDTLYQEWPGTSLPTLPTHKYPTTKGLMELQGEIKELLQRSEAIENNAKEHFGEVTVVLNINQDGSLSSIPVFPNAEDPVRAVFSHSAFHQREGMLPRLKEVRVNLLGVMWDETETEGTRSLNLEALHFSDFGLGHDSDTRRWPNGKKLVELQIYTPMKGLQRGQNVVRDVALETLKEDDFFIAETSLGTDIEAIGQKRWNNVVTSLSKIAQEEGFWFRSIDKPESFSLAGFAGLNRTSNPYSGLEVFQESVLAAFQPSTGNGLFSRARQNLKSVEGSDVGMDTFIGIYANRPEVRVVFDGLEDLADRRSRTYGISHELTEWLVEAVNQIEAAVAERDPSLLTTTGPGVTRGTLGEAPAYFSQFCGLVEQLSSSKGSAEFDKWLADATTALDTLEVGLSDYSSL